MYLLVFSLYLLPVVHKISVFFITHRFQYSKILQYPKYVEIAIKKMLHYTNITLIRAWCRMPWYRMIASLSPLQADSLCCVEQLITPVNLRHTTRLHLYIKHFNDVYQKYVAIMLGYFKVNGQVLKFSLPCVIINSIVGCTVI